MLFGIVAVVDVLLGNFHPFSFRSYDAFEGAVQEPTCYSGQIRTTPSNDH